MPPPKTDDVRPAKKRKLNPKPNSVARFLDTEAIQADEDESDDSDDWSDDGFIDDEPVHTHHRTSQLRLEDLLVDDVIDDSAVLEKIATHYEQRAATERHYAYAHRPRENAATSYTLEEQLAEVPRSLLLPTDLSPPMYTIRILPYWEYSLMRYMSTCPGIISSGMWGAGSGYIFVECEPVGGVGDTAVMVAHLRKWKRAHRFYNRDLLVPRLLPISQRTMLLERPGDPNLPHPFDVGNRWVRIASGPYKGDLAFEEEMDPDSIPEERDLPELGHYQNLWVVPRIALYASDYQKHPPRHLFDPDRFSLLLPHEKLQNRNNYIVVWLGKNRVFGGTKNFYGLERLQLDRRTFLTPSYARSGVYRVDQDLEDEGEVFVRPTCTRNAVPTEEELDLFRCCGANELNVPFHGHTCALQAGDLVVTPDGRAGTILDIHSDLVESEGRTIHVRSADLQADRQNWTVRLSELRLHILAVRRRIRVGDRVHQDTVEVYDTQSDSAEPLVFDLQLRHVAHDFRAGDVVRVLRGPRMGQRGLLLSHPGGGAVTIFPGNVENEHSQFMPYSRLQHRNVPLHSAPNAFKHFSEHDDLEISLNQALFPNKLAPGMNEHTTRPELTIQVDTNLICFEHWDHDDTQITRSRVNKPWDNRDLRSRELAKKMRDDEQWLLGMFVRVTGQHSLKGLSGEVKGYSWTSPRPSKGYPNYQTIQLTVGLDMRESTVQLPFASVVHRDSGLPLDEAHILMDYDKVRHFARPRTPDGGDKVLPDETWPGHKSLLPPVPVLPRWEDDEMYPTYVFGPAVIGEHDGTWFLGPNFVNKRIDVLVADLDTMKRIAGSNKTLQRQVKERQFSMAGAKGHLKILTKALEARDVPTGMTMFTSAEGKNCSLPLKALLPCRVYPNDTCISRVKSRVIIIGPDVGLSRDRIGQYAEVQPYKTQWPERVVRVKFPLELSITGAAQYERFEAEYHLSSLCLATNIQHGHLQPTNFNVVQ
ncbi:hypothetical protein C8F01DRAFT_1243750 [Mycena amicta]|nr:hypothetical protein C8F01DRAFT_1243750 [Mycena amicta]